MKKNAHRWRVVLVAVFVVVLLAGLATRLAILHLGPNTELRSRITQVRHSEKQILVGRGRVLDRNGAILGLDLPVQDIFADPKIVIEKGHLRFTTAQLARVLELDPQNLYQRLNRPDRRFAYVRRYVKQDLARRVAGMQMPGVHFANTTARSYPHRNLMSHALGFSNWEGVGSAGVEQRFNGYLRGQPGLRITERDGRRREVYNRRSVDIPPQVGADVHLTLDLNVQFIVEQALDKAMIEHSAKGAWVIVQKIRTGEILAIASRPDYDPNEFRDSTEEERRNRAISFVYEPGSTFKIAVIAAALNERVISPNTLIHCENGTWFHRGRPLRDFHPYGTLSVRDVLKKSSNIGAAKIALKAR
ncbi:MAG: penicillin-binding transpeptidase domain-containing protein, partial [Verrucomicrobiota bacterium]